MFLLTLLAGQWPLVLVMPLSFAADFLCKYLTSLRLTSIVQNAPAKARSTASLDCIQINGLPPFSCHVRLDRSWHLSDHGQVTWSNSTKVEGVFLPSPLASAAVLTTCTGPAERAISGPAASRVRESFVRRGRTAWSRSRLQPTVASELGV